MGQASEDTRARLGSTIGGRFRLDAILGEGGFGAVYRAHDVQSDVDVALKLLHARLGASREVRARFRREAESAARIGHPGIVGVLGTGEDERGDAWIALELLEGRSLAEELTSVGPLPLSRVVSIVSAVCDALGAAHARGIVHRDLKPDNVFLTAQGPKLLDFGVSKVFEGQDLGSLATRTGAALGTPYYMPPEQAQGKREIDHRADLYALGVVIFELLTGERPFEDDSYPMLVLKICTEPPPPVTASRSDVPAAFESVLARLLAKSPDARFASCAEVSAALAPFASHDVAPKLVSRPNSKGRVAQVLGASTAMASAPTALSIDPHTGAPLVPDLDDGARNVEAKVRGGAGVWVGAILLLIVLGGVGYWSTREETPEPPPETPVARLPEPQPPVVQPFRVPEGSELAWRWLNPLPRAMPAWTDVAVGGRDLVAFVGREGRAARLERGVIRHWTTGIEADLHGVTWIGPAQAIAVGAEGALLLLLQSGPRALATGTTADLRDVAATSMTDAIVVGDDGTVIRLPGFEPRRVETGRSESLLGVYVSGDDAFAVGAGGVILRLRGDEVVVEREGGGTLRGIGGCGDEIYAVGDGGTVLRRRDATWSEVRGLPREDWQGVACANGRVVASGRRGGVLVLAGDRGVRLDSGSDRMLRGICSAPDGPTWVVGDGGFLAEVQNDRLRILTAGHTGTLFDVASLAGTFVAVGANGALLRERERRFVASPPLTDAALVALAAIDDGRLLAVGDHGVMVEIEYDAARVIEEGGEVSWRDVVSKDGGVLAVGTRGGLARGVLGALVVSRVGEAGFRAVAGTPDDAVVVGDAGTVMRVRGNGHETVQGCGDGMLRGAWRDDEGTTWIVGDEGRVFRLAATGDCVLEREGGRALHGVGPAPSGGVLAVGERGMAFVRGQDGAWVAEDLDTDLDLHGVLSTERDVMVVGVGGLVLRHARL